MQGGQKNSVIFNQDINLLIDASSPLAAQAFTYVGSVNGQYGLYSYNASSNAMTQLLEIGNGQKIEWNSNIAPCSVVE